MHLYKHIQHAKYIRSLCLFDAKRSLHHMKAIKAPAKQGGERSASEHKTKREHQRTMPLLKFATIGAGRLRRSDYSEGSTSLLSSLPPTEESFSAGSINSIDSFVYPEVDTFAEDDNEEYDPYLRPLMKERRIRLGNRIKSLPTLITKSPVKEQPPISTPDTAHDSFTESPTYMRAIKAPRGRFRAFKPPSFLDLPTRFSHAKREDSIVIHLEDEEPKPIPAKKEREYWNRVANKLLDNYDIVHVRTAETLLQLGNAHMRCEVSNNCFAIDGPRTTPDSHSDITLLVTGIQGSAYSIQGSHSHLSQDLWRIRPKCCHGSQQRRISSVSIEQARA